MGKKTETPTTWPCEAGQTMDAGGVCHDASVDWSFPCDAEQTLNAQNACNDAPTFPCEAGQTMDAGGVCHDASEEWVSPCTTGQLLGSNDVCVDVCEPDRRRRINAASGCVEIGACDDGASEPEEDDEEEVPISVVVVTVPAEMTVEIAEVPAAGSSAMKVRRSSLLSNFFSML
ncbi:hypothetical protein TeGR_g13459 [Tetraparma gracilis]|uniref:Uncharacterized protein n=1 Tax=Tetraparma gracilis TaxID=2962635 RepID=A0ABQ6MGV4_9STRA|nr:hypothetical protein TeGR_g13459 [Tetraparma gracilis]